MKFKLPGSASSREHDEWVQGLQQFNEDETRLAAWRIRYSSDTRVRIASALASAFSTLAIAFFALAMRQGWL